MNQVNNQMAIRMEADAREIRKVINFQNKFCSQENDIAERQAQYEKEQWERRKNRRECDARKHANVNMFLLRNFWCILLGVVIFVLDLLSLVDFLTALMCSVLIGTYLSLNFVAYVTRNYNFF